MSGKFSRNKGRREEQQLVLYLAKLGYKAERILRQYQEAGQADVKAVNSNGNIYQFEMKSRRESFKSIYDLYNLQKGLDGCLRFVISGTGTGVAISTHLPNLLITDQPFLNISTPPVPDKKQLKVYVKILKLKELKQAADFLVIKDNNKPRLFIRYWG